MKLDSKSLRALIKEVVDTYEESALVCERPWIVKLPFTLSSSGGAEDAEGESSDGIKLALSGETATVEVVVDTYWNPHAGDESGNSLVVYVDGEELIREYFPRKLDDDSEHVLLVSCSPWYDKLFIGVDDFIVCDIDTPFEDEDQVNVSWQPVMEKDAGRIKCDGPVTSSL